MFKTLNKGSFGIKFKSLTGYINVNSSIQVFVYDSTSGTNIDKFPIDLHIEPGPTKTNELNKCSIVTDQNW